MSGTLIKYLRSRRIDLGWFCDDAKLLRKTTQELYEGTGHPEFWIAILCCTQPDKAAELLVEVVSIAVKNNQDLTGYMLGLQQKPRNKVVEIHDELKKQISSNTFLANAVLNTTRYVLNKKAGSASAAILDIKKQALSTGIAEEVFLTELYSLLHTVTFDVWKGEYE